MKPVCQKVLLGLLPNRLVLAGFKSTRHRPPSADSRHFHRIGTPPIPHQRRRKRAPECRVPPRIVHRPMPHVRPYVHLADQHGFPKNPPHLFVGMFVPYVVREPHAAVERYSVSAAERAEEFVQHLIVFHERRRRRVQCRLAGRHLAFLSRVANTPVGGWWKGLYRVLLYLIAVYSKFQNSWACSPPETFPSPIVP
jgi:hypothetical protein